MARCAAQRGRMALHFSETACGTGDAFYAWHAWSAPCMSRCARQKMRSGHEASQMDRQVSVCLLQVPTIAPSHGAIRRHGGCGACAISRDWLRVVQCALDMCQWHVPGLCGPKAVAYLFNSVNFPCVPFTVKRTSRTVLPYFFPTQREMPHAAARRRLRLQKRGARCGLRSPVAGRR
jgi:hypothetical protein